MLCGRNVRSGQKRGALVGKTKRGKGTKIMGIADSHGLPLALRAESASPAEVTLVEATLDERVVADVPKRLIGDKAYDSDGLDKKLMENYGTEMIAPNKVNRRVKTQDGRPLRRFARRWKIERLFAWLFNFRRLVVRYEYHAANFQGFIHLAAAIILLRRGAHPRIVGAEPVLIPRAADVCRRGGLDGLPRDGRAPRPTRTLT